MKSIAAGILVLCAGVSLEVAADCSSGTQVIDNALGTLLEGNTVCAKAGGGTGLEIWQEEHHTRSGGVVGELWDYKKGASDPVDPRVKLGTWQVTGSETSTRVTYTYDRFGPPNNIATLSVHNNNDSTYSFCTAPDGSETAKGKIKLGINVGCSAAGDFP